MRALIQRVTEAQVSTLENGVVGAIGQGLLVFVAFLPTDTEVILSQVVRKILGLRIFADEHKAMNLSVRDVAGGVLLVPQFTLAADLKRGMRPSFTQAAPPKLAAKLFNIMTASLTAGHQPTAYGRFGADMKIHLINDGPATFYLDYPQT